MSVKFILASSSPRRREILENLGFDFEIITSNAEENADISGLSPEKAVQELASVKGRSIAKRLNYDREHTYLVISADTVVVRDGKILGKPKDREEARKMLKRLSGKKHSVITGLCIWKVGGSWTSKGCTIADKTDVYFKTLSDEMIEAYLDTGEYADKAGAYGIQGKGACLVEKIKGDYFNVVGFPLNAFYELLTKEQCVDLFHPGCSSLWAQRGGSKYGYKRN